MWRESLIVNNIINNLERVDDCLNETVRDALLLCEVKVKCYK
mgnify:FL=1